MFGMGGPSANRFAETPEQTSALFLWISASLAPVKSLEA